MKKAMPVIMLSILLFFSCDLIPDPTPEFHIPVASQGITIDGVISDWSSIAPFTNDSSGETAISGADIEYVKLAVNPAKTRLFILFKSFSGNVNPADVVYALKINSINSDPVPFERQVYSRFDSEWTVYAKDDLADEAIENINGSTAPAGQYIEFAVDLVPLELPDLFSVRGSTYPKNPGNNFDSADLFGHVNTPWSEGFSGVYCINETMNMVIAQSGNSAICTIFSGDTIESSGTVSGSTMTLSGGMPDGNNLDITLTFSPAGDSLSGSFTITDASNVIIDQGIFSGVENMCPWDGEDISMISPYTNNAAITGIHEAFSVDSSAPWGFEHNGIDFFVDPGSSALFRAVSHGEIFDINLFANEHTGNWQVNVGIRFNSRFWVSYGFEPMTLLQTDGQNQLNNILSYIQVGDIVSQGDPIGDLTFVGGGTHVHFGLYEINQAVCPEPYFDAAAVGHIIGLLESEYGVGTLMCYE
ncbi:MAG: M23 family metallopeptidase [bacterium]|nr:M23 family metallopeptidase [bacterium]